MVPQGIGTGMALEMVGRGLISPYQISTSFPLVYTLVSQGGQDAPYSRDRVSDVMFSDGAHSSTRIMRLYLFVGIYLFI